MRITEFAIEWLVLAKRIFSCKCSFWIGISCHKVYQLIHLLVSVANFFVYMVSWKHCTKINLNIFPVAFVLSRWSSVISRTFGRELLLFLSSQFAFWTVFQCRWSKSSNVPYWSKDYACCLQAKLLVIKIFYGNWVILYFWWWTRRPRGNKANQSFQGFGLL